MKDIIKRVKKSGFQMQKKFIVMGVRNPISMDDYVGVKAVQGSCEKVLLIGCETISESYVQ